MRVIGRAGSTLRGVELRIINPAEWIPRVRDLLAENWAETGFDFPFAPDVAAYQRLWDAGMVFAVGAFDGDMVAGYCTVTVTPHPHNMAVVVAANDALFVRPQYSNGLTAGRLILAAEREASRRGAGRFTWHCRAGTPLAGMLERRGYTPVDQVVMKEI